MRNVSRVIAQAFNERRTKTISNTHTDGEGFFCMVIKSHFGMRITTEKSYLSICVGGEL